MNADQSALVAKEALRSRQHPHGRVLDPVMTARVTEQIADGSAVIELHMDEARAIAWRAALPDVAGNALAQALKRWRMVVDAGFEAWDRTGEVAPMCLHAAITFPEEAAFVDGVLQRLPRVDFTAHGSWFAGRAVAAARSLDELRSTLSIVPPLPAISGVHPWTLLARHGIDALPLLEDLFARATKDFDPSGYNMLPTDTWVSFLEMFAAVSSSTAALKPLLVHGELRLVRFALERALQHQPRALLHTALQSGAVRPGLARDIAAMALRRDPTLIDVATTELQRATLLALLPPDVPLAATSSLPPELQQPPWAGKKPGKGVVVDGLVAPNIAPRLVWRSGQQQAWASAPAWPDVETAVSYICGVKPDASVDDAIAHVQERRSYAWASDSEHPLLSLLPEPLLRGMWAAFPVTAWHLDTVSVRQLVARLGLDVVDGLLSRAGFGEVPHTHTAPGLEPRRTRLVAQSMDALLPVASLKVVPLVVSAIGYRDARRAALAWLDTHPAVAVAGLVPLALGAGAHRAAARTALQLLAQRGHRGVIDDVTADFGAEATAAVQALLSENPLALAKPPKRPGWVELRTLAPVLTTAGERLDDHAVGILVDALSVGTIDVPYAGLEAMTAALQPSSVSALAWSLFRQWWLADQPNADAWVLSALAHVGDERAAGALVEQMTVWAGDGLTARAKTGVQVLTTMASRIDAALLALFRFSKRAPSKSLSRAATEAIDAVALARNLSVDELADRLVPDLGLNDDGSTTIELGDRTLTVRFDGLLRPILKDSDGKTVPSVPRLSSSMDAALHAEAKVKLKQLTKAAADVGMHMLRRLESALAEQRRWPVDVALTCVLQHPLLQHVAQRLVWTDLDDNGTVLASFRVAEDGTFANENDDTYALRGTSVGLLHPLSTSPATLSSWRTICADYELQQPFAQLERPVCVVDEHDAGVALQRFVGVQVPTGKLFSLEARGWKRGAGTATRRLDGVEATLHYTPGIFGGPDASKTPQTLGVVELAGGRTWASLSPLLYSELLHDLERLRA